MLVVLVVIQANFIIFATSIQYRQEILGRFIAAASWQMRYWKAIWVDSGKRI
jgi:hypothetical protein